MSNYDEGGARKPRERRKPGAKQPAQKLGVKALVSRLELAYATLELPADTFAKLCLALLPEEYASAGRAPAALVAPPNSSRRVRELAGRFERGHDLHRPDDPDVPEDRAIILRAVTPDTPTGALAPKFRTSKGGVKNDTMVEYDYVSTKGADRAELPECSDRCIREGDLWREREAAREAAEDEERELVGGQDAAAGLVRNSIRQGKNTVEPFHARLRRARLARGWGLKRLAKKTGYHFSYLSLIERGDRAPTWPVLEALAQAYERDVSDMVLTSWPD